MSDWYVDLTPDGAFNGFHNPSLSGRPAPETAKPITDEQHQEWWAAGADRFRFPDGADAPVRYEQSDAEKLFAAREERIRALRSDCSSAILGGYVSNALGTPHIYPTTERDQANLNASVTAAIIEGSSPDWSTPFWCADETDAWAFVPHSGPQIIQVGRDVKNHIVACQDKLAHLTSAVSAAMTPDAVAAITW